MKQLKLLFLTFLLSFVCHANDSFTFSLADNQKVETTNSFSLAGGSSVHLIVAKNRDTRDYDVITFFSDSSGNVKEMNLKSFEDKPDFKAAHMYNGCITVLSHTKKELVVIDYNILSGNVLNKKYDDFTAPVATFFNDNSTLMLHPVHKGDGYLLEVIQNGNSINTMPVTMDEETAKEYKAMLRSDSDIINTQEYVKNGSLKPTRIYFEGGNIVFTNDDRGNNTTNAIVIDAETGKAALQPFKVNSDNAKELTSYVTGKRLFTMNSSKEDITIKAFGIDDGQEQAAFSLSENLKEYFGTGNTKDYLKKIHKTNMKPTLTINKAGNNYSIRVDAVNTRNYNYHNWWYLHQMMWQQQQMMNNHLRAMQNHINLMRGPSAQGYSLPLYDAGEEENYSFTIPLSQDLQLMEKGADEVTDYKEVDKQNLTKQFIENKSFKYFSTAFGSDAMSYIYMDKHSETFTIHRIAY